jgi:hypothetical protein
LRSLNLLIAGAILRELQGLDSHLRRIAVGFEHHSLRALNALQGATHRIGLAAQQLELSRSSKVVSCLIRTPQAVERQTAEIVGPRIAAAVANCGAERVVGFQDPLRKESMDTAAVQVFQHVLARGQSAGKTNHGYQNAHQFPRHERTLLLLFTDLNRSGQGISLRAFNRHLW